MNQASAATDNSQTTDVLAGRKIAGTVSARIHVDGRDYINFAGSGYLALGRLPEIRAAVLRALEHGVPFSQQLPAVLGGADGVFDTVEQAGGGACGTETSIYFASGYLIGIVGLASLEGLFDLLALDESAHYSLRDAARICGLPTFTFAHCDVQSLDEALRSNVRPKQRPLIVTDGVFATTGRVAPLADYATLLERYDGRMFVDESHAFGVIGDKGRGASEFCHVEHLATGGTTLSKALCAQGAIIGCSSETARRLRSAPPIRGACAGSPLSAIAATASLGYVARHPGLRQDLSATAEYLRRRLRGLGADVATSPAPIVAFKCGTKADMRALQRRAFARGIYVYLSTYIGAGAEGMIRCAVFRDHTRDDIDALIDTLGTQ
jgi:8-amino-7-oxononanoate synthase